MVARALLIGVSRTSFRGKRFPRLPGVNIDIDEMESLLSGRGFAVTAPRSDESLTADSVAEALVDAVDATLANDTLVLYFSGHGYQYPDLSGDEDDEWDEALVCSDRPIPDDWFRDELWPRATPGSRFVVVVDACHSETAVLALRAEDDIQVPATIPPRGTGYYRLILSACRDREKTIEMGPKDSGGGVVTQEMLAALKMDEQLSYKELWGTVATNVGFRYRHRGLGTPRLESLGPDDSLLNSMSFVVR